VGVGRSEEKASPGSKFEGRGMREKTKRVCEGGGAIKVVTTANQMEASLLFAENSGTTKGGVGGQKGASWIRYRNVSKP